MKNTITSLFEDFGLLLLSIALFLGGIILLSLKIPFWSMVFGLASTQIGIVLIIITFDSFIRKKTKPITEDYKALSCVVCGKVTFVPKYTNVAICDADQLKIVKTFKASLLVVFALVTIGSGILLIGQSQELRRAAREEKKEVPICEQGSWFPESCRCGIWENKSQLCPEDSFVRTCGDEKVYCCQKRLNETESWGCKEVK